MKRTQDLTGHGKGYGMGLKHRWAALPGMGAMLIVLAATGTPGFAAQGTLPLPAPGTTPAPAATPSGTAAPAAPDAAEAKARAATLAAKANIDVTGAWARATPGGSTTAAIYLHIVSAKDPDRLVGADSAAAANVEVHDDKMQNGVMKMTALPALDIPAGGTVNFTPNGQHIMLTGLKAPLKEGDSFLVTLKFDKAGSMSTAVRVLGAAATGLPGATTAAHKGDTTAGATQPAPAH